METEAESRLRNLYRNYVFQNRPGSKMRLNRVDQVRFLGGMEALLQCLGKLQSGVTPAANYTVKEKKFLFFTYTTTESYQDFILRKCDEFVSSSQNTPCLR